MPVAAARAATSDASRDLPMPASPVTSSSEPEPARARRRAASARASSPARPNILGLAGLGWASGACERGGRLDGGEELGHRGRAVAGRRLEPAPDGVTQGRRHVAALGRRADGVGGDGGPELVQIAAREGALAVERLPERDAEAEQIGALVGGVAAELLERHVGRRAEDRAGGRQRDRWWAGQRGLGHPRGQGGFDRRELREPEVGHAHASVVADEDVVGLEVAVDDAGGVGGGEAAAGGAQGVDDRAPAARGIAQPAAEGGALDQLHDDEELVVGGADLVDGDDVGVGQARHGARFTREPGTEAVAVVGAGQAQDLEGDLALPDRDPRPRRPAPCRRPRPRGARDSARYGRRLRALAARARQGAGHGPRARGTPRSASRWRSAASSSARCKPPAYQGCDDILGETSVH